MNYFGSLLASRAFPLLLPKDYEDEVHRYVDMHQSRGMSTRERTPFRRQLDFWAFCLACALARKMEPLDSLSGMRRFTDTRAVQVGDELSELLAVVAFNKIGHNDASASDPAKIIEMCNRLAGAGANYVLRKLQEEAVSTPLESALNIAESLVNEVVPLSQDVDKSSS